MRRQFSSSFLALAILATSACTSRPSQPKEVVGAGRRKPAPLAKEGQKVIPPAASSVVASTPSVQNPGENQALLNRLQDSKIPASDGDLHAAMNLHPAARSSLEEALVITAQLRLLQAQVQRSNSFQSHDLYPDKATTGAPSPQGPSMERTFQELEIDLPASFQNNAHLKTVPSMTLVQELLEHTNNSAAFTAPLRASLASVQAGAGSAAQITDAAHPEVPPVNNAASPVPAAAETTLPAAPLEATPLATGVISASPETGAAASDLHQAPSGEVKTAATDLKRSDALLMQAQKLADKGEFKQAIDSVARIDAQDPFFDQAKEKIRVYSNRAVQDLRQKAALAFQNALPINDAAAKQAYLIQAKSLLEKALKEYPSADQLDTVKDNLAVIAKDLDSIATSTDGDSTAKSQ